MSSWMYLSLFSILMYVMIYLILVWWISLFTQAWHSEEALQSEPWIPTTFSIEMVPHTSTPILGAAPMPPQSQMLMPGLKI